MCVLWTPSSYITLDLSSAKYIVAEASRLHTFCNAGKLHVGPMNNYKMGKPLGCVGCYLLPSVKPQILGCAVPAQSVELELG